MTVRRNAFGRQVDSFEATVDVDGVGEVDGVFIRAPWAEAVGAERRGAGRAATVRSSWCGRGRCSRRRSIPS